MDYKIFVIIAATLALFLGVMLLAAPKLLIKTSEVLNRDIDSTKYIINHRLFFGVLILVLGVLMFYIVVWS